MYNMRIFILIISAGLFCATLKAQDNSDSRPGPKPTLSYEFSLDENGDIQGAGRDWLIENGQDARFVMLGEAHGVADIARFSGSLYDLTDRTALAIETDVWTAANLEALAQEGMPAFEVYYKRRSHQYGVPFYAWREESALLSKVVSKANGVKPSLWGLDQVFVLAGKTIVDRLRSRIKKQIAKDALVQFENSLVTRPALIGYGKPEDIEYLYTALLAEDDREVLEIAEAIKVSNEIYAPFTRGAGSALLANQKRERQMKELFFTYFSNARKYVGLQKPMLKFGTNHMYRGITQTGVIGLGGFADALATARGEKSLSISVFCGPGSTVRQFDGTEKNCTQSEFEEYFPTLAKLIEGVDGHLIVDTLALRLYGVELMQSASEAEKAQFASFDAIVIIQNSKAASQFQAEVEDMDLTSLFKSENAQ